MQVDAAQYCQYDFLMTLKTDQMADKQCDAQLLLKKKGCNSELEVIKVSDFSGGVPDDIASRELANSDF